MNKLYKGVEGYDVEYEYSVMLQNVKHSEALKEIQQDAR